MLKMRSRMSEYFFLTFESSEKLEACGRKRDCASQHKRIDCTGALIHGTVDPLTTLTGTEKSRQHVSFA